MPRTALDVLSTNPATRDFLSFGWLKSEKPRIDPDEWLTPEGVTRFLTEIIQWMPGEDGPAPYQIELAQELMATHRLSVRGPHGLGKTALCAWLVSFFMFACPEDLKVITTAGNWRQLTMFLWPEIHKWIYRVPWSQYGMLVRPDKEVLTQTISMPRQKYAFAVASDQPNLIEGAHAKYLFYIFDEAKSIPAGIFDAAEGAFSTGNTYAFAPSTPGEPSGRFFDIQHRAPEFLHWSARHVKKEEVLAAGRMTQDWVDKMTIQWATKQPDMFANRVEGEFYSGSDRSVIPLAWVELAIDRWLKLKESGEMEKNRHVVPIYGLDVAEGVGRDLSTLAMYRMTWVESIDYFDVDVMQLTGEVINATKKFPEAIIAVDTVGVGAGVYRRLAEQGAKVASIKAGEKADFTDSSGELEFVNLRAGMWWSLREMLAPDSAFPLALPPDDRLKGELTTPLYETKSDGKIAIESKDELRKRLDGKSTDAADSVLLAIFGKARRRRSMAV